VFYFLITFSLCLFHVQLKSSAASDDDDVSDEDDELAFVQQHLYEGGDGDDDEGNADYKFNDFFVADKSERRKGSGKPQKFTVAAKKKSQAMKASSDSEASDNEDQDGEDRDEEEGDSDSFAVDEEEEEDEDDEGSEEEDSLGDDDAPSTTNAVTAKTGKPSAAQQRNKALSTQISSLEEELMASKPWELRGEVKASDRPENSFLELHADIER
jgi:U3 small nucleolar RNA-associated protein MPP10